MYKLLISNSNNIYYNLALESYLLSLKEEIILLWVNSPCVVIGYNQNTYKEANLNYLKENDIKLARRITGGGAVYHDLNNLNISLITKSLDNTKLNQIIKDALLKFNIHSVINTSNDLLINDCKFSGQASFSDNDMYLYHSCILIDTNLDVLSLALTPSKLKLESHAVDSVRKRVINLKDINSSINVDTLIDAFKSLDYLYLDNINLSNYEIERLKTLYSSNQYIYSNPAFNYKKELIINKDIYDIELNIENNIIKDIKIYTDSSTVFNFHNVYKLYINKEFNENSIDNIKKDVIDLYY